MSNIAIIGAGWAGLAAAVELTNQGHSVNVYEACPNAGGRARSIQYEDLTVDNGQHLLIGAYQELLRLLKVVGLKESEVFERKPMALSLIDATHENHFDMKLNNLWGPLSGMIALINAKGISFQDKISIIKFLSKIRLCRLKTNKSATALELLNENQQSQKTITQFWEPICVAALTTPIELASAELFINVLKDTFSGHYKNSNCLFPKVDLEQCFPKAAVEYIERHGGHVHFNNRIESLLDSPEGLVLKHQNKQSLASKAIIATPPTSCHRLLSPLFHDHKVLNNINQLRYQPITNLYFRFSKAIPMLQPMTGVLNAHSQWVFPRKIAGQADLLSVIISTHGEHMNLDKEELAEIVHSELTSLFSELPSLKNCKVIRDKRATISACVENQALRPTTTQLSDKIFLAGDYTYLDYPSTLEGAVRSGVASARRVANVIG